MNKTLKELLYERLTLREHTRDELRIYGEHVRTFRNPNGFDSSSVDRACRHLTEEGRIEPKTIRGFNVSYKAVQSDKLSHTSPLDAKKGSQAVHCSPKPIYQQKQEAKGLKEKQQGIRKLLF